MAVEHCVRDGRAVGYSDTSNLAANDRGAPAVASAKCKSAEDKGPQLEVRIPTLQASGSGALPQRDIKARNANTTKVVIWGDNATRI